MKLGNEISLQDLSLNGIKRQHIYLSYTEYSEVLVYERTRNNAGLKRLSTFFLNRHVTQLPSLMQYVVLKYEEVSIISGTSAAICTVVVVARWNGR
jgi:hypothetical protein